LLPTIALGIGVVVAGLGIGAFLSAMQTKSTTHTAVSTQPRAPIVTPVPQASREPLAIATIVAHPTPTPVPTAVPTVAPTATPEPTQAPTAEPTATRPPTARPVAIATHAATPPPTPVAVATAAPRSAPTRRPTPRVVAAAPAQTATESGFGGTAQGTVRRYLDALMAGNENGAYAALGKAAGDPGAELSEEAFIDRTARVTSLRTTNVDATGATVEAEISSDRGTYYATYHVTNGPSGPVIDQHDYIKV
jgi:hypothetical protein